MKPVPPVVNANSTAPERRALRAAALATRQALDAATHARLDQRIIATLMARLQTDPPASIGSYWPMRGEADLRGAMQRWHEAGIVVALPRVVAAGQPLRFERWTPQSVVRAGARGAEIVDAGGAAALVPDLLLVPCVGFTTGRYRLGYGGGYYDRTLAARRIRSWGIAYECNRLDALTPQAHDVALDAIITEDAVY